MKTQIIIALLAFSAFAEDPKTIPEVRTTSGTLLLTNVQFSSVIGRRVTFKTEKGPKAFAAAINGEKEARQWAQFRKDQAAAAKAAEINRQKAAAQAKADAKEALIKREIESNIKLNNATADSINRNP